MIAKVLTCLRCLVTCDEDEERSGLIGIAIIPYYKHILPVLNIFVRDVGKSFLLDGR